MAKKAQNEQNIQSFNPRQYRAMSLVFIFLSLINMVAVFIAFSRTGFGLWHAEDGLSKIAEINQYVHNINENTLDLLIHKKENAVVLNDIYNIEDGFVVIASQSEEYRAIDLSNVDSFLSGEFESAARKVSLYQTELTAFTSEMKDKVQNNTKDLPEFLETVEKRYVRDIEPLKTDAETTVNTLFEIQNKATYDFFVRCAQQFLFVIIFLLITMTAGLIGIHRMKKAAKTAAETIETEHKKAEKSRAKSMDIAMTNIISGFRNRYGLETDLDIRMTQEPFTIALYKFADFDYLNAKYGRSAVDAYVTALAHTLKKNYDSTADIYSTDTDEFCFVFKNALSETHEEDIMFRIARAISRQVDLEKFSIQSPVYGCYYHCDPGSHTDCDSLLNRLDKAMDVARKQVITTGQNAVWNVNNM